VNYTDGTINCHDNPLGYIIFCNPKNETHIFVSALDYNAINGDALPSEFKIYSPDDSGHIYMIPNSPIKGDENKIYALKTASLNNQLFIAYNLPVSGIKKISSYSDFRNENDILFNYDETERQPESSAQSTQPAEPAPIELQSISDVKPEQNMDSNNTKIQ
ncbi:MAG: hypothetical protein AABY22_14505, partial [Nanoarchaeota archaeon]